MNAEHDTKGSRHVLVVDDEPGLRDFVRDLLVAMGHDVTVAADATAALDRMRAAEVDIVICDMLMPGLKGDELLKIISDQYPHIPVIIMTGFPDVESAVECIKLGAVDYLTKPFSPADLRQALQTIETVRQRRREKTSRMIPGKRHLIAGHEIVALLGEGAMGSVFLTRQANAPAGETHAVKILKLSLLDTPGQRKRAIERFIHEARAAAQINHEHIVNVKDYGITESGEVPYIVMEHLRGETLGAVIARRATLPLDIRVKIIRQIAVALAVIHQAGIVHRDIKPSNIMIDSDYTAKLTDFSICHLPDSNLTRAEALLGSPAYLAPEAFSNEGVTVASDIFSLGVVAYELFLGRKPFEGPSVANFAHSISRELPERPRSLDESFPRALEDLLADMLKKDPEERPSANSVADTLAAYLSGEEGREPNLLGRLKDHLKSEDWA